MNTNAESNAGPLLAIDTSGTTARIALLAPDGSLLAAGERTGERHSAYLLPLCDELFARTGARPATLRAVACGAGPGSFTGLRVGMAVAKGLAMPFDLPFALISSLAALALDLGAEDPEALLVPCIDAGKGEVYGQLFRLEAGRPIALGPEERLTPAAWLARLAEQRPTSPLIRMGGTGFDRHQAAFTAGLAAGEGRPQFAGPRAESIGRLALARPMNEQRDDLSSAVPSYGRPPDITAPKKPASRG